MSTLAAIKSHHPPRLALTDLNRATSARYAACEMTGGHVPSGESVERVFPGVVRNLPVCARCRVPFGGPKIASWSSGPKRGAKVRE